MSGGASQGESSAVTVRVEGLSVYTHHGVTEAEREVGQRMVFDLCIVVDPCRASETDQLADTVDYEQVCELVARVATERSYNTLERLSEEVASVVLAAVPALSVWVRATKPEPPIPHSVGGVSVELTREGHWARKSKP